MTVVGVLGEAVVDVLPDGDGLRPAIGGSPLNVAVGLARLGVRTHLLSPTSSDRWGDRVRRQLDAEGVVTAGGVVDAPTAVAFVELAPDGQPSYRFLWDDTADLQLDGDGLLAAAGDLDVLHLGSVAAVRDPAGAVLTRVLPALADRVLVTYDPNVRPSAMGEGAATLRRVAQHAGSAHVVKASEEDLALLLPASEPLDAARALLASDRTVLVMLTLGADGSWLLCGDHEVRVPAHPPPRVVDTVGAGDATMAALVAGLVDRGATTPAAIRALGEGDLHALGSMAARASGLVVGRAGADPPRRAELS